MKEEHTKIFFYKYILLGFIVFSFSLLFFSPEHQFRNINFYWQLFSIAIFIIFLFLGNYFSAQGFFIFGLFYQLCVSLIFQHHLIENLYLLDNNGDPWVYIRFVSIAFRTFNFSDFFNVLIKEVPEFSDWGYPIFLYPFFKYTDTIEDALFYATIAKSVIYSFGALKLYKLSSMFLSEQNSKLVYLLWILNPVSIFFNVVNIKENLFVTICIYAIFYFCLYLKTKDFKDFLLFTLFLIITSFFRIYVTIFIFFAFLMSTIAKRFCDKYILIIWGGVFVFSFIGINIISRMIPAAAYYFRQSLGGSKGISMPVLFVTAFISPIPSFSQNRFPDNYMVCGYSVFSILLSIFAIYELIIIIKEKKVKLYPLVNLVMFNKYLVIMTAKSNEYRYQYPLLFCYFILMLLGFNDLLERGISISKYHKISFEFVASGWCIISLLLTVVYNRGV